MMKYWCVWSNGSHTLCDPQDTWGAVLVFKDETEYYAYMERVEREEAEEEAEAKAVAAEAKEQVEQELLLLYADIPPMAGQTPSSPMGKELFALLSSVHGFTTLNGATYTSYLRGWRWDRRQEAAEAAAEAEAA